MDVYLDTTTLIALGTVGELDIPTVFDGRPVVPAAVADEVTTEPARTNVERFRSREGVHGEPVTAVDDGLIERAKQVLDEDETNGDVRIIADALAHTRRTERFRRCRLGRPARTNGSRWARCDGYRNGRRRP